jgi:hypothetical protein
LDKLPHAVQQGIAGAYAESIQTVFIIAAPIGVIAFLASWLIPQVELRQGIGATPAPSDPLGERKPAAPQQYAVATAKQPGEV